MLIHIIFIKDSFANPMLGGLLFWGKMFAYIIFLNWFNLNYFLFNTIKQFIPYYTPSEI